ncbi:MAG: GNAT family N-acetyltransferase [Bacillota bacterium]|nr:GNAT family N-acetyltransferase [Bacillota bacterium]
MMEYFLAKPGKEYEDSFKKYVKLYKDSGDSYYYEKYKNALENFDEYIQDLKDSSNGINIPEDWAATSTFWLIDNNEVVGVTRVRHQEAGTAGHIGYDISPKYRSKGYGTNILRLALDEALKLGIKEVIVTCNTDNLASKKIIEKNNGKLLGTVFDEEEDENLYRYSITIVNNLL